MKIVGYGICGAGEADRYMGRTMMEFSRLCDETIIVLNNATEKERELVSKYGFKIIEDNREWGLNQHLIKGDLMKAVGELNPDYCVCLDMDEVFDTEFTGTQLLELFRNANALYFYIVNLWESGWNRKMSFWNIRAWKWNGDTKIYNKPLHCGLAPEWCYYYASYAPFFVKHYGLMTREDRQKKIARYQKYDPKAIYKDRSYYDGLASDGFDALDEKFIKDEIKKEVGVQTKRKIIIPPNKKIYYVRKMKKGEDLGVIDIAENILHEVLARNPEWINLGEVGTEKKEIARKNTKNQLECPLCGFLSGDGESALMHKQTHG